MHIYICLSIEITYNKIHEFQLTFQILIHRHTIHSSLSLSLFVTPFSDSEKTGSPLPTTYFYEMHLQKIVSELLTYNPVKIKFTNWSIPFVQLFFKTCSILSKYFYAVSQSIFLLYLQWGPCYSFVIRLDLFVFFVFHFWSFPHILFEFNCLLVLFMKYCYDSKVQNYT